MSDRVVLDTSRKGHFKVEAIIHNYVTGKGVDIAFPEVVVGRYTNHFIRVAAPSVSSAIIKLRDLALVIHRQHGLTEAKVQITRIILVS